MYLKSQAVIDHTVNTQKKEKDKSKPSLQMGSNLENWDPTELSFW